MPMDSDEEDAAAYAANYWKQVQEFEEGEDRRALEEYQRKSDPIKQQLVELLEERHIVAARLRELRGECERKEEELKAVNLEYEAAKIQMADRRVRRTRAIPHWLEAEFGTASRGRNRDATLGGDDRAHNKSGGSPLPATADRMTGGPTGKTASVLAGEIDDDSTAAQAAKLSRGELSDVSSDSDDSDRQRPGALRPEARHSEPNSASESWSPSPAARTAGHEPHTPALSPAGDPCNSWMSEAAAETDLETPAKPVARRSPSNGPSGDASRSIPPAANGGTRDSTGDLDAEGETARVTTEYDAGDVGGLADNGPEITQETLSLVHDGVVYTEPEIMRGVPVKRITPEDDYWDPEWESIESKIELRLADWKDKLQAALREGKKKDLANRQINRGNAIMDFLKNGPIHPYQFVAKKFITNHLITYDTLYRLVATLDDELPKFHIKVAPLDWLRQRIHELHTAEGGRFNLARTIHDMYRDPKLVALRTKAGFGNIGRPSGSRTMPKPKQDLEGTPSRKRKAAESTPGPGRKRRRGPSSLAHEEEGSAEEINDPTVAPRTPKRRRRQNRTPHNRGATPVDEGDSQDNRLAGRSAADSGTSAEDDFGVDGYTTSDTFSMDQVTEIDWRISQVKTVDRTSSTDITQYWHWVGESQLFEHQVLKEVEPASWGVYKDPIDFHLRLKEVIKVEFSAHSLKIAIHTRPVAGVKHRGVLVAQFNRHRTRRRFLSFMHDLGVKLDKVLMSHLEHVWKTLKSEELPVTDSDS